MNKYLELKEKITEQWEKTITEENKLIQKYINEKNELFKLEYENARKLDTLTDEKDIMDKLKKEEEDRIKELDEKQSVKITKTIEQLIQEMNKKYPKSLYDNYDLDGEGNIIIPVLLEGIECACKYLLQQGKICKEILNFVVIIN